ncbi:hypothetical protein HK097_007192 [Rhizophlyctis rosea]|uniref:Uncharacterized protein n=1 Tax=Rhizophlyctis rosea TaxID=64517 RepID=A0AAD5SEX4_9FUNG|nr:hypothetical protein HK097_007192 [Rhizophlyctis rosea]
MTADSSKEKAAEGTTEESKDAAKTLPAPTPAPAPAEPKKYILSSSIYYLRENAMNKRAQQKEAKQVSARLPSVPKGLGR